MNRSILRNTIQLAGAALIFCGSAAYAQIATTPFLSNEGMAKGEAVAKDSLQANDLLLTTIATSDASMFDTSVIPIKVDKFDMETGKASIWIYNYYSPSKNKNASAGVVQLALLGFQSFVSVEDPDSGQTAPTMTLDISGTYATSDKMVERVKADANYQAYHTQYPGTGPALAMLRNALPEDAAFLPGDFPTADPYWTLTFGNGTNGQDVMLCFVASKTGTTVCQSIAVPSSVTEEKGGAHATIAVAPNPSNGHTRVDVALPSGVRTLNDVSVELYDAAGRKVADLTDSFKANALQFAEFDSSQLPAGVYYCRATGAGWHGMAGVVVQK